MHINVLEHWEHAAARQPVETVAGDHNCARNYPAECLACCEGKL